MTNINSLNTTLDYFGKVKTEGERKKKDLYRIVITDNEFPAVKMYGIHMFDLKQATMHRFEFLSNSNVIKYGFHPISTEIVRSDKTGNTNPNNQYFVKANVQGEPFESERCSLEFAIVIYDMLVNQGKVGKKVE